MTLPNQCYIKPAIQRLINQCLNEGTKITWEQYEPMFINSYERAALYPHLDTQCLLKVARQMQAHFHSNRSPVTYEETALHLIFPLLCERLEKEH